MHNHTHYSMLDGTFSEKDLIKRCKELNMSAVAITDHGVLHGVLDFAKAAKKENIKPIIGIEAYIIIDGINESPRRSSAGVRQVLLAKNIKGYRALHYLSSKGFLENFYYYPRIHINDLKEYADDLICLSGSVHGPIGFTYANINEDVAKELLKRYKDIFKDNFYIELQRHKVKSISKENDGFDKSRELSYDLYIQKQDELNRFLINSSKEMNIECVATNDVHYINREDNIIREILINVSLGEPLMIQGSDGQYMFNDNRKVSPSNELYLKSPEQMRDLFSDIPNAIFNSIKIADQCNVDITVSDIHYPIFEVPKDKVISSNLDRSEQAAEYLYNQCKNNISNRYTEFINKRLRERFPNEDLDKMILDRLNFEFSVIKDKQFCDYLLIVQDFILHAKKNNIPVGPGRGSGVGSIVLYLLEITDLEPLSLDLFFERFINPERPSYPDIDIDVCMARRGEVISYIQSKYGINRVAHIVTYGTLKTRMAIRDVGRAFGMPMSLVNTICGKIPDELGITIDAALETSPELKDLYEENFSVKTVIDYSKKLEGCIRNTGIHAAGIIVGDKDLDQIIPLFKQKDSPVLISQFSMKSAESSGLLKIDVLGLRTLTLIQRSLDRVKEKYNKTIDISSLDLDDKQTLEFLQTGRSIGIFQMESDGMRALLRDMKPSRFTDLVAIVSLYRPGPMSMIPDFIDRKHGKQVIDYYHDSLKPILENTYGIIVYQEQVMQIAEVCAGYSKGEGDILRRAMGKKEEKIMQEHRVIFCDRAVKRGYDKELAKNLFDKMEKFAAYGFNKSHAAAYAFISFITAYIKSRYPDVWFEVLMSMNQNDRDKTRKFISDMNEEGITLVVPNINLSGDSQFIVKDNNIMFPISAIKGLGVNVGEEIVSRRQAEGEFKSIPDFINKIDLSKVSKKSCISLIQCGAFDSIITNRIEAIDFIEENFVMLVKRKEEMLIGINDLFDTSLSDIKSIDNDDSLLNNINRITYKELREEHELLGQFVSRNPIDILIEKAKFVQLKGLRDLNKAKSKDSELYICFIDKVKTGQSSDKRAFVSIQVSDGPEIETFFIWPDDYEKCKDAIVEKSRVILFINTFENKKTGILRHSCKWVFKDSDCQIKIRDKFLELKNSKYTPRFNGENKAEENMTHIIEVNLDIINMSSVNLLKKFIIASNSSDVKKIKIKFKGTDKCPDQEVSYSSINLEGLKDIDGVNIC